MSEPDRDPPASRESSRPDRLLSIDALRGFDMIWIVGGGPLAQAICKWWGTSASLKLADQFEHVEWEGFHFWDLIFPLFLFVVGVVLPFSLRKYQRGEHPKTAALARISRRVVLLFALGLIYNGLLRLEFEHLRVPGVLQRIAICYGCAAVVYLFTTTRVQAVLVAAILLGYWAVLSFVPAPGGTAGDLSKDHNLPGYLDRRLLPGELNPDYYGYGDNEGLLSTIPAVATALLGALAGQLLLSGRPPWRKSAELIAAGGVCLGAGLLWSQSFPIIKLLWTSSFVLVAGGWSLILLGLFHAVIDVLKLRAWSYFFVVIGMNAITIYMAARIIPFNRISGFFFGGLARKMEAFSPGSGPIIGALGLLLVEWLFLLYLYRRRIFLRV